MPDIIAMGEMLIDFVSTISGVTLIEAPAFEKAPGGAPANVAVGLARLGLASGFVGMVGDDDFGHFLEHTLIENGVDTGGLRFSTEARTALAFVSLKADGDRDFMFYRHPGADMLLSPDDIDPAYISSAHVFHFGSITLGSSPCREATLHAIEIARQNGLFVSYDPNLRLSLWPSAEAAREGMLLGWPHANLIKVNREELEFLSGESDMEKAARKLWHDNLRLLAVTLGESGCAYFTPGFTGHAPGFSVKAIDTTGAGDAFLVGLLFSLYSIIGKSFSEADVAEAVRFANATGALATTKRGAIPALPTLDEIVQLIRR